VGGILYFLLHFALLKMKIDDPCDACVVHGFGGFWGLLAPGLFCTDKNVQYAKYPNVNTACGSGEQFGVQVVGVLCITAWTVITTGFVFLCFHVVIGMRIKDQEVGEESEPKSNSEQGFSKRELSTEISRDRVNEKGGSWSPHTSQRAPITQAIQQKQKIMNAECHVFMFMSYVNQHVSTKCTDAYGFMYFPHASMYV
jgi:Amt family ammonium transporter